MSEILELVCRTRPRTQQPNLYTLLTGRGNRPSGKLEVTGQVAKKIAQQQNISFPTTSDGLETTLMVHRMGYYTMDSLYLTHFCRILTDFTNFCTALTEMTVKNKLYFELPLIVLTAFC